jgi:hypothetical protein
MFKADKEEKTVASPLNDFQKRPLEEIGQYFSNAEGMSIPARFFF